MRRKILYTLFFFFGLAAIFSLLYLYLDQPREYHYAMDGLHPEVEQAKNQLFEICEKKDIPIVLISGFRSFEEQDSLYAQGRTTPGQIVTYAEGGESYHNYGLAIDFAMIDPETNKISWDMEKDWNNNGIPDWQEVVDEAKKLGFEWGGDWKRFKDYPHLQITFGQSIRELKRHVSNKY